MNKTIEYILIGLGVVALVVVVVVYIVCHFKNEICWVKKDVRIEISGEYLLVNFVLSPNLIEKIGKFYKNRGSL